MTDACIKGLESSEIQHERLRVHRRRDVVVPRTFPHLSSSKILTSEWCVSRCRQPTPRYTSLSIFGRLYSLECQSILVGDSPGRRRRRVQGRTLTHGVGIFSRMEGCRVDDAESISTMGMSHVDVGTVLLSVSSITLPLRHKRQHLDNTVITGDNWLNCMRGQVVGEMVFCTGFVHADLHPGNVLVRRTSPSNAKPQVVLLDVGHACELGRDVRMSLGTVWRANVSDPSSSTPFPERSVTLLELISNYHHGRATGLSSARWRNISAFLKRRDRRCPCSSGKGGRKNAAESHFLRRCAEACWLL
jgi:hypothetical protein